ncbi:MAG: ABC transporter permease [Planctomycetes bacterium]|nr:ABC transporter permease [Planctomycetota bacterium]
MASKRFLVAQREFLENVRTKTFWIGILAVPVLIVISIGATWVLNKFKETKSYAVVDYSEARIGRRIEQMARLGDLKAFNTVLGQTGKAIAEATEDGELSEADQDKLYRAWLDLPASDVEQMVAENAAFKDARRFEFTRLADLELDGLDPPAQEKALAKLVDDGKLFAYFTIGSNPLHDIDGFTYVSENRTDSDLRDWYGRAATEVVRSLRIADAKISRAAAALIQERVAFREQKADAETGEKTDVTVGEKANKFAPVAFVYLLWIAVFTAAQMLLTNTVEEKSNRIIEVLLSSCSPGELMSGKIWGIAATGMTIIGSWIAFALLGVWLAPKLIAGFDFPLMAIIGDPRYLISFAGYFLFGYLLYAAMLVAIGSVCNSLKEAQNLMQPVVILLIIPLVSMMFIVQEPNGLVAKVMSYIPLFTPFTMMNRAGGPPEVYEYVITGILMVVSVWIAFKAAGKIFRIGVLMTGKPPKLKEIFGWLRTEK